MLFSDLKVVLKAAAMWNKCNTDKWGEGSRSEPWLDALHSVLSAFHWGELVCPSLSCDHKMKQAQPFYTKQQTRCQWRIWVTPNPSYSLPKSGCSTGDWANFLMLCSIKNRRVILIFPCLKTDEQDPRYSLNTSFSSYWVQDPTRQALWAEWSQQKPATLGFTFQSQRRPIQKAGERSFVWAL